MATQYIYVLKRNGIWGTSSWKDGVNLTQSAIQSLKGAIRAAEHLGYEIQGKGHEYVISVELPDGTFSFHQRSPGAFVESDINGTDTTGSLKVPD